jgi:hypothetical protein
VDKKFRAYGPEDEKKEYHKRPPIEAVNSFLKTQYGMVVNKVRGLKQVASYALFSILAWFLTEKQLKTLEDQTKLSHQPTSLHNIVTRQRAFKVSASNLCALVNLFQP